MYYNNKRINDTIIENGKNVVGKGNYPWELHNIDGIIEVLKQINKGEI